ncbi:MAG: SCP2 sterol-binding domain-containing protein [Brevefilum sp.]|jgi:putative sterol carrier protein
MSDIDVTAIMNAIPSGFNPEKAKDVNGIVQCVFTGAQASNWIIAIKDQTCVVNEGVTANPDLTITAKAEDGVNLLTGKLDPMRAYMLGKIRINGDLGLGMKLVNLFDR